MPIWLQRSREHILAFATIAAINYCSSDHMNLYFNWLIIHFKTIQLKYSDTVRVVIEVKQYPRHNVCSSGKNKVADPDPWPKLKVTDWLIQTMNMELH